MFDFDTFRQQCRDLAHAGMTETGVDESTAVVAVLGAVYEHCEETLRQWQEGKESLPIACGPGCGTCCMVNVAVLEPEVIGIAHYVRQNFSGQVRRELKERLLQLAREVRWLDEEERLFVRRSCAFLDDRENCSIWPQRPLMCRAITSTDAHACREALAAPVFGEEKPVVMNLVQRKIYEAAFQGLGDAMQALGIDARSSRLSCAASELLCESGGVENLSPGLA